MAIVIVKSKESLSLKALLELTLRHVYKDDLTSAEIRQMQDSVNNWANKLKLDKELERLEEQEEYELEMICLFLQRNEEGSFEERKKLFKNHKIDYRKFHNLPGARTLQDYIAGKKLEQESKIRYGF